MRSEPDPLGHANAYFEREAFHDKRVVDMSAGAGADSKKVVIAALIGNFAIAVCKFVAAFLSGSTSTLAEAVHSVADTGNQALLLLGFGLALKRDDDRFAFGRASEQYFWPFVVALMLFSVGGTFAIFEGVSHFSAAPPPARPIDLTRYGIPLSFSPNLLNYVVLGTSFLFEAMSFRVAFREFKIMAKGRPIREAIFEARDPTIPLVLAEDTTALLGLGIALAAIVLTSVTGHHEWDAIGSIVIGILLCLVATVLARITHGLLIGKAATLDDQARVLEIVESSDGIERVTQLLTMHLGPDFVILAMKVAFKGEFRVAEIEAATNAMEKTLRDELPHMKKIFVEPDSEGDGRGLAAARELLRAKTAK